MQISELDEIVQNAQFVVTAQLQQDTSVTFTSASQC